MIILFFNFDCLFTGVPFHRVFGVPFFIFILHFIYIIIIDFGGKRHFVRIHCDIFAGVVADAGVIFGFGYDDFARRRHVLALLHLFADVEGDAVPVQAGLFQDRV